MKAEWVIEIQEKGEKMMERSSLSTGWQKNKKKKGQTYDKMPETDLQWSVYIKPLRVIYWGIKIRLGTVRSLSYP